jgi:deazaflavin-dependent oxidoreductase (nitroreductase family)
MNGNSFVTLILKSPLHSMMSGSTMLISVCGRKTGRTVTTPVNYYQDGNTLWILTSRDRTWWRNLRGGAPVHLQLRGKDVEGFAETLLDEESAATQIGEYVSHFPMSVRTLGIRMNNGKPEPEDLARSARERLMVRVVIAQA